MKTTPTNPRPTKRPTTPPRPYACRRRRCRGTCRIVDGCLVCPSCGWSEIADLRRAADRRDADLLRDLYLESTIPFLSTSEAWSWLNRGERVSLGMRRRREGKAVRA